MFSDQLFLRVPPFPGSAPVSLGNRASPHAHSDDDQVGAVIEALARARVGGDYWGAQPSLPPKPYALVRLADEHQRRAALDTLDDKDPVVCWSDSTPRTSPESGAAMVRGVCDPWDLVRGATTVIANADDELLLIAALATIPVRPVGEGRFSGLAAGRHALMDVVREHVLGLAYVSPFTDEPITASGAIDLCAFWRALIDSNRPVAAAYGFAAWKRPTVAPLLWNGGEGPRFTARAEGFAADKEAVVWKTRTDPAVLGSLERGGARIVEAEDGFIRSIGLGADCVPPLSLVVDHLGIYFDPRRPSDLEELIEAGGFSPDLLDRARRLIGLVVDLGVSKYAVGGHAILSRPDHCELVLVTGQVEDDRSVQCGGGPVTSNLELLRRVRADAAHAHILYKPHPDVEAGHRAGAIAPEVALQYADAIVKDQPITSLIDLVDEVHVNTSLAGFEALLRGKPVTTHGVPFYAGWGLTRDLGAVPARRNARRTLEELVAAALLTYPRYLDPKSGLPCTAEILVRRLSEAREGQRPTPLVRLRRLQGAWKRRIAAMRGAWR